MSQVTVIGAGVAGLCAATELVARGVDVEIIDKNGGPSERACSWWAGGMLAPFCEGESAPEPVERLGQDALSWWSERTQVIHKGTLVVAPPRDRSELRHFALKTRGSAPAVPSDLEQDLTSFREGLFFEKEAHLSPRQALSDLAQALKASGIEIKASGEPCGTVIDCRGLVARDALEGLRGVRGEMLMVHCPGVDIARPVRFLHPRIPIYIVPRGEGVYMIGATMIESEDRRKVTVRSVLELLSAAYALNPAFAEAEVLELGSDLRPAFADNIPRVTLKSDRIYVNGLYRHGYLMAPVLARMVADYVVDGKKGELVHDA